MAKTAYDLEIDAIQHVNSEHYDAAILFDEKNDYELANKCKIFMQNLKLKNNRKPKICLFNHPCFCPEATENPSEVIQYCTFIFCLITKTLPQNHIAALFKEEAIGLTRLAMDGETGCPGHKYRRYCVRPLVTEGNTTCNMPSGLRTIHPINMVNEHRAAENLSDLFENNLYLRFNRELSENKLKMMPALPETSLEKATDGIVGKENEFDITCDLHNEDESKVHKFVGTSPTTGDLSIDASSGAADSSATPNADSAYYSLSSSSSSEMPQDENACDSNSNPASETVKSTLLEKMPFINNQIHLKETGNIGHNSPAVASVNQRSLKPHRDPNTTEMIHDLQYTSGLPIDENNHEGNNHGEKNKPSIPYKENSPSPNLSTVREIHFYNCNNIQVGDAGNWDLSGSVAVHKGKGKLPTEIVTQSSDRDSGDDDDEEYSFYEDDDETFLKHSSTLDDDAYKDDLNRLNSPPIEGTDSMKSVLSVGSTVLQAQTTPATEQTKGFNDVMLNPNVGNLSVTPFSEAEFLHEPNAGNQLLAGGVKIAKQPKNIAFDELHEPTCADVGWDGAVKQVTTTRIDHTSLHRSHSFHIIAQLTGLAKMQINADSVQSNSDKDLQDEVD